MSKDHENNPHGQKRSERFDLSNISTFSEYNDKGILLTNNPSEVVHLRNSKEDSINKTVKYQKTGDPEEISRSPFWDHAGDILSRQYSADTLPFAAAAAATAEPTATTEQSQSPSQFFPSNLRPFNNPGLKETISTPSRNPPAGNTRLQRAFRRINKEETVIEETNISDTEVIETTDPLAADNPDKSNQLNVNISDVNQSTPAVSPVLPFRDHVLGVSAIVPNPNLANLTSYIPQASLQETESSGLQDHPDSSKHPPPGPISGRGPSGPGARGDSRPEQEQNQLTSSQTGPEQPRDRSSEQLPENYEQSPQNQGHSGNQKSSSPSLGSPQSVWPRPQLPRTSVQRGHSGLPFSGLSSLRGPTASDTPEDRSHQVSTPARQVEGHGPVDLREAPDGTTRSGIPQGEHRVGTSSAGDQLRLVETPIHPFSTGSALQQPGGPEAGDLASGNIAQENLGTTTGQQQQPTTVTHTGPAETVPSGSTRTSKSPYPAEVSFKRAGTARIAQGPRDIISRFAKSFVKRPTYSSRAAVSFTGSRRALEEPFLLLPSRASRQGRSLSERLPAVQPTGGGLFQTRQTPSDGVGFPTPRAQTITVWTSSPSTAPSSTESTGAIPKGTNRQSSGGAAGNGGTTEINPTISSILGAIGPPNQSSGVGNNPHSDRSSGPDHRHLPGDSRTPVQELPTSEASPLPSLLPLPSGEAHQPEYPALTPAFTVSSTEGAVTGGEPQISRMEVTEGEQSSPDHAGGGSVQQGGQLQALESLFPPAHEVKRYQQVYRNLMREAAQLATLFKASSAPNTDVHPAVDRVFMVFLFGNKDIPFTNETYAKKKNIGVYGYPKGQTNPGQEQQYLDWLNLMVEDFFEYLYKAESQKEIYRSQALANHYSGDDIKTLIMQKLYYYHMSSLAPYIEGYITDCKNSRLAMELMERDRLQGAYAPIGTTQAFAPVTQSVLTTTTASLPPAVRTTFSTQSTSGQTPTTIPTNQSSSNANNVPTTMTPRVPGGQGSPNGSNSNIPFLSPIPDRFKIKPDPDPMPEDERIPLWVEDLPHMTKTVPPSFNHPEIFRFKVTNHGEGAYVFQPLHPAGVLDMVRLHIPPLPGYPGCVQPFIDDSIGALRGHVDYETRNPTDRPNIRLYQYSGRVDTTYYLLVFQVLDPPEEENHPVVRLRQLLQRHSQEWMQTNNRFDVTIPNMHHQLDRIHGEITASLLDELSTTIKQIKTGLNNLSTLGRQVGSYILPSTAARSLVPQWNYHIISAYDSELDRVLAKLLDKGVSPEVVNSLLAYNPSRPAQSTFSVSTPPTTELDQMSLGDRSGKSFVQYSYPSLSLPVWSGDRRTFGESWKEFDSAVASKSEAQIPSHVKMHFLRQFVKNIPEEYHIACNNYRSTREDYEAYKSYLLDTYKMSSKELAASFLKSVELMDNLSAEKDADSYKQFHRMNLWLKNLKWYIQRYSESANTSYDPRYWWLILEKKIKQPYKLKWELWKDAKVEANPNFEDGDLVKEFISWSERQLDVLKKKGERERCIGGNYQLDLNNSFPIFSVAKNKSVPTSQATAQNGGKRHGKGKGSTNNNNFAVQTAKGGSSGGAGGAGGPSGKPSGNRNRGQAGKRPAVATGRVNKSYAQQGGKPIGQNKTNNAKGFKQAVPKYCHNCGDKNHTIANCKQDLKQDYRQGNGNTGGYILCYDNSICYHCGGQYHRPDQCKSKKPCGINGCVREHMPFLHPFDFCGYNTYRDKYPKRAEKAKKNMEAAIAKKGKKKPKAAQSSLHNGKKNKPNRS